jgi:Protein of unknown function (DUF1761)
VEHVHHHLNHLAIITSAVILWALGAAWYSPALFAKPWMALLGIQPDASKRKDLMGGMIASFIGDLILALVLAHFVIWSGASTIGWGAFIGFLCWFGFIAAPNFPQGIYESRPHKLFLINAGYWFVGLLIIGPLLAVWH